MKFASLFSGGGGCEIAAKNLGFEILWGVDNDREVNQLHSLNFNCPVYEWDLEKVSHPWADLARPDVLHISPPCQNFSRRNLSKTEECRDIKVIDSCITAIAVLNPSIVVIENVIGYLLSRSWKKLSESLIYTGYHLQIGSYDAADYGVPQNRKRLFAIATKKNELQIRNRRKHSVTIESAIADLLPTFEPTELTKTQEKFLVFEDRDSIKSDTACLIKRIGIQSETTVRAFHQQSFTLLASIGGDGKGGSRKQILTMSKKGKFYNLSMRAIARLQSFPDWYQFGDACNRIVMKAIGNSVPPAMYEYILKTAQNYDA